MASHHHRSLFQHLPPPAECFALLIGTLELVPFGLAAFRDPTSFSDAYGLPIANTEEPPAHPKKDSPAALTPEHSDATATTQKALIAAIAARNLQNGILLLTFGLVLRDRRSLGVAVLVGLVATVADTVIVRAHGVREKVWGHYIGVFNSAVVGGWLIWR